MTASRLHLFMPVPAPPAIGCSGSQQCSLNNPFVSAWRGCIWRHSSPLLAFLVQSFSRMNSNVYWGLRSKRTENLCKLSPTNDSRQLHNS